MVWTVCKVIAWFRCYLLCVPALCECKHWYEYFRHWYYLCRISHESLWIPLQLSAQPPHRLLPLKKNLNHFCLDCHSVCDNVYCSLTMFSALAAVRTVDCAIEIVLITLHYITLEMRWSRSCQHYSLAITSITAPPSLTFLFSCCQLLARKRCCLLRSSLCYADVRLILEWLYVWNTPMNTCQSFARCGWYYIKLMCRPAK